VIFATFCLISSVFSLRPNTAKTSHKEHKRDLLFVFYVIYVANLRDSSFEILDSPHIHTDFSIGARTLFPHSVQEPS
jgi:hypothetical protein